MRGFFIKLRTYFALGLINLFRVAVYRLSLRLKLPLFWGNWEFPIPRKPFFTEILGRQNLPPHISSWGREGVLFGYITYKFPEVEEGELPIPDWFYDSITSDYFPEPNRKWFEISDFDEKAGDIKKIWELSRFEWAIAFAQRAAHGNAKSLKMLNLWVGDWIQKNPPYYGPNWKCGQEASIRVLHIAASSMILGRENKSLNSILVFIYMHLGRIAPSISYALAQDNNHATSEAAALFVGGSWLNENGVKKGKKWAKTGRKQLEERVARLIQEDGSFSQHSTNYHRLMLETLNFVEVWRRKSSLPPFSSLFYERAKAASMWLYRMTDPQTGAVPNIGANDGARILPLTNSKYEDFRPTIQLAMALFANKRAFDDGEWNNALAWLGVEIPQEKAPAATSDRGENGGFVILRKNKAMALLRVPKFLFRPAHADPLHLDFWLGSRNILRDGGTYSYFTDEKNYSYFGGIASHNSVQFDGSEPMPRLGRFLFGEWLNGEIISPLSGDYEKIRFSCSYNDYRGAYHSRKLELSDCLLRIEDDVSGFENSALLRFRLAPEAWELSEQKLLGEGLQFTFDVSCDISRMELVEGLESRRYLEKTCIPVLELEVNKPTKIITEIRWKL